MTLSQYFSKVETFCKTDINTGMPNLDQEMAKQIATSLGLTFIDEKETESEVCFANSPDLRSEFKQSFTSMDLFDYIYAVLHSSTYRKKYKEFLKIDFPRVPYPTDRDQFWKFVKLGGELRQIHLLERPTVGNYITQYPEDGDNVITKPHFVTSPISNSPPKQGNLLQLSKEANLEQLSKEEGRGRVYINEIQYFTNVPEVAWDFYNGGYHPAQKWLQDRKGQELTDDDMLYYQKMLTALNETVRIISKIDSIGI
jgi:predicted helicase